MQPKEGGATREEVCKRITKQTDLMALTQNGFYWKTIRYFLSSTGIPVNFGITIALGFIVGVAIAGQTFYLFTIENLKQFGALKAMGVTNWRLVGMILMQAGRRRTRLRLRHGYDRGVLRGDEWHHASGGLVHDGDSRCRRRRRSARHHHADSSAQHSQGTGAGARDRISMTSTSGVALSAMCQQLHGALRRPCSRLGRAMNIDTQAVICRQVSKEFGVGDMRTMALRGVDLEVFPGR